MFSPYEYESSKFVFAGVKAILKSIALFTSKALLRLNININLTTCYQISLSRKNLSEECVNYLAWSDLDSFRSGI